MKKITLAVMLTLFASAPIFAQLTNVNNEIKIGKVRRGHVDYLTLSVTIKDADTTYILRYDNQKQINLHGVQQIPFKGYSTLNGLYDILKAAFKKKDRELTTFTLGTTPVIVTSYKITWTKYLTISTDEGSSVVFTDRELYTLFGGK